MYQNFVPFAVIIFLSSHTTESKSQSFWYPVWYTKDLGTGPNQKVQVGSETVHIPVTSTDTPVHVNLNVDATETAVRGFPEKVDFLALKNKQCLLKIPLKRGRKRYERKFIGISEGIFPHPENKERFVVCHEKMNGDVECLEINCLKGTYFDPKERICRYKSRGFAKNKNPKRPTPKYSMGKNNKI